MITCLPMERKGVERGRKHGGCMDEEIGGEIRSEGASSVRLRGELGLEGGSGIVGDGNLVPFFSPYFSFMRIGSGPVIILTE